MAIAQAYHDKDGDAHVCVAVTNFAIGGVIKSFHVPSDFLTLKLLLSTTN